MTEKSDLETQLQAMSGYLELAQLNSELAVAYLKDAESRLNTVIEEMEKATIELGIALGNLEKARKEIHSE